MFKATSRTIDEVSYKKTSIESKFLPYYVTDCKVILLFTERLQYKSLSTNDHVIVDLRQLDGTSKSDLHLSVYFFPPGAV